MRKQEPVTVFLSALYGFGGHLLPEFLCTLCGSLKVIYVAQPNNIYL